MMDKRKSRIINGEVMWQCSTCGVWKFPDEYYKDKRTPNGLKAQCKACHIEGSVRTRDAENSRRINREHMRRARLKKPKKFQTRERIASRSRKRTNKTEARYQLNLAVKRGEITRPDKCSSCGKTKRVTAHHPDYSKPFDVIWLCYECHGELHIDSVQRRTIRGVKRKTT